MLARTILSGSAILAVIGELNNAANAFPVVRVPAVLVVEPTLALRSARDCSCSVRAAPTESRVVVPEAYS